jgi:hypothetical protein
MVTVIVWVTVITWGDTVTVCVTVDVTVTKAKSPLGVAVSEGDLVTA